MSSTVQQSIPRANPKVSTMRALVFRGTGQIGIEHVPIPKAGPGEAVIRVTLTTICGTDLHILKGEYPVRRGLTIGHEPVGIIHELGIGISGYKIGDRVLVGAITPCGQCSFCLSGHCRNAAVRSAAGNLAIPSTARKPNICWCLTLRRTWRKFLMNLRDEQVVLSADIASTGISAAESAEVQIGDTVAVFAQGPIGLCATAGAKLKGAVLIIAVESDPVRTKMARSAWAQTW